MLTLQNIYVQYGDRVLFNYVNFTLKPGERVGLVGRNGAGKSSLLKIIAKEQRPDEGVVDVPSNFTIGYLHQDMLLPKGRTVMEETLTAFDELKSLEKRLSEIEKELEIRTDYESDAYADLVTEISDVSERLHLMGGSTMEADAERILGGLGFKNSDMSRQTTEFSGGWQMRVELAKMLLQNHDLLLLDEPTNHLDIESILWLEGFLKGFTGMAIVISHDRRFLDNTTNRTAEIMLGKISDYKASYSKYMELSADRKEQMKAAYENQKRQIADKERTIARFMAKATKTKMAQSMQKQLDKVERIEISDEDTSAMLIRFPKAPRSGEVVAEVKGLVKHYGNIQVLNDVDFKLLRGERVGFVGQNGQGKSTLAKLIVERENPTSGYCGLGHNISIGYYAQNQAETLDPNLTLLETMELYSPEEMRTKLRGILGAFLFSGEDVEKKVFVLSGGERARLALACMLLRPFNLLVLDEPTNHLDMISKEVLKNAVKTFDGTLLVVSHDRDFLAGLTDRTIEFRDHKLKEYLGDVNFFLEKRALQNMREVEKATAKRAAKAAAAPKTEMSREEKRALQKEVSRTEKQISKYEELIKNREKEMVDPAFFHAKDSQVKLNEYNKWKEALDKAFEAWEKATEAAEA